MWILVSLRNHDGDGNEYSKKEIDLDKQNNNFALHHAFLYISLPSLHDYDVKLPHFWFCRGREQTDNNFSSTLMQSFRIQLQKNLPTFDELNVME